MDIFQITGRQLRDARELLGLSCNGLAHRTGISRLTLRLWEASGEAPPNALTPNRVLRFLEGEGVAFDSDGGVHRVPPATPVLKGGWVAASSPW
jgi:transcriptional regulator with XRE-family HTH domain